MWERGREAGLQSRPGNTSDRAADWQGDFLRAERLPPSYLDTARAFFDPLAAQLADRAARVSGALLVAVNGSQGSGKSTLCAYLVAALAQRHGLRGATLSLDDFYLTRAARQRLAAEVHPLLATRGVPGTHDTALLQATLRELRHGRSGARLVPAFDKARDDRAPESTWSRHALPLDVVLLEGWCVGARAEAPRALARPVNRLEREQDPQARWRRFSNDCLRRDYEPLWDAFDCWVMLRAPSFEQVLAWRTEQEEKLADRVGGRGEGLMDAAALRRFVEHFERQTRRCLDDLPDRVDILLQLDAQRRVVAGRGLGAAP